jgi:hypothetical protein
LFERSGLQLQRALVLEHILHFQQQLKDAMGLILLHRLQTCRTLEMRANRAVLLHAEEVKQQRVQAVDREDLKQWDLHHILTRLLHRESRHIVPLNATAIDQPHFEHQRFLRVQLVHDLLQLVKRAPTLRLIHIHKKQVHAVECHQESTSE